MVSELPATPNNNKQTSKQQQKQHVEHHTAFNHTINTWLPPICSTHILNHAGDHSFQYQVFLKVLNTNI